MHRSDRWRVRALAALASLSLVACASPAGGGPSSFATQDGSADAAPSIESSAMAPEGIPPAVWGEVLADLAGRLDGDIDPSVVTAEAMTWNDGAWGCPEEGQMYTQAIVEGFQVVVEVDGEEFDYRSDGQAVRLCDPTSMLEGGG